jgi:hypothetical protein
MAVGRAQLAPLGHLLVFSAWVGQYNTLSSLTTRHSKGLFSVSRRKFGQTDCPNLRIKPPLKYPSLVPSHGWNVSGSFLDGNSEFITIRHSELENPSTETNQQAVMIVDLLL